MRASATLSTPWDLNAAAIEAVGTCGYKILLAPVFGDVVLTLGVRLKRSAISLFLCLAY